MIRTNNGALLARVTGWRRLPLDLTGDGKLERGFCLMRFGLVAVMRYRPDGAVLYGPPVQGGRRRVLARVRTLREAIERGNALIKGAGDVG